MQLTIPTACLLSLPLLSVHAKSVPPALKNLYDSLKTSKCDSLAGGFKSTSGGPSSFSYCQKSISTGKAIYIRGPSGQYPNMDVDCDGDESGRGDSRCSNDPSNLGETAFKDEVSKYGISDLNANIHPYVVFGNEDHNPKFSPKSVGVTPLSVMAVVCGNKLIYGVWGDTNGGTLVGEASISLATACYGTGVTGDNGHDGNDVLYIAFTGDGTVPKNANWKAKSYDDFESSISYLGDKLVGRLIGNDAGRANETESEDGDEPVTSPVPSEVNGGNSSTVTSSARPKEEAPWLWLSLVSATMFLWIM